MLLQLNKETARILSPVVNNPEVRSAIADYAMYKIKELNECFHRVDATDVAGMAKLQGQYIELKALLTLKDDAHAAMKGEF